MNVVRMRRRVHGGAVLALLISGSTALGEEAAPPSPSPPPLVHAEPSPGTQAGCRGEMPAWSIPSNLEAVDPDDDPRSVWVARCAMCHGADGRGRTAMGRKYDARDFGDDEWQRTRSDDEIRCAIVRGRPDTYMRAFAHKLTEAQVQGLVSLIRSLRPVPVAARTASQVP